MIRNLFRAAVLAMALVLAGCATVSTKQGTGDSATAEVPPAPIIQESLKNLGIASPQTLVATVTTLGQSTPGYSNQGLELSYVAYKMIQILYPLYLKPEYQILPPTGSIYPNLFKQVEAGKFPQVSQQNVSFLTLIIPPMAVLYTNQTDVVESSLEALDHAASLNPNSVLPPYLKGFIEERKGADAQALAEFQKALDIDASCYPAAIGKARILLAQKKFNEADVTLENLANSIPPDATVFRLLAEAQFSEGLYSSAEDSAKRSLAVSPNGASTLVLLARIYGAQKEYAKALAELTNADKIQSPTPQTILLRASIHTKNGNTAAAVATLAAGVKSFPGNQELADAYGKALIESGQTVEGGKYLTSNGGAHGTDSLEVLVADAINSKKWKAAATYVSRLLATRSDEQTLRQAYVIYHALGDAAKVLELARRLHETVPGSSRYLLDYAKALVAAGKNDTARTLIDAGIAHGALPETLSTLYFLRSEIQSDPAAQITDLRSALLENLENVPALIATAHYYLKSGEIKAARRFAQQAQAFMPSGQQLPKDLQQLVHATS